MSAILSRYVVVFSNWFNLQKMEAILLKKKLLVLVAVFCLALFTCGAASAATNPYADWHLSGNWNVSVSVSEFTAGDAVFPDGFDPALRNSFLDLQAGYKEAEFRTVLPGITALVYYLSGSTDALEQAVDFLQLVPYGVRIAVPTLLDAILANLAAEGGPDFENMEIQLEQALRNVYFPISDLLELPYDFNIGDYSETAAGLIVSVVEILYEALLIVDDPKLEYSFNEQFKISVGIDLKQLEKLLLQVLIGNHAADLKAMLTYVMQNPSILTALQTYFEGDVDPLSVLQLAANADVLQSYKTAASAAGTGTMVITAAAKLDDIEEISSITTNCGAVAAWNMDDPILYKAPVIENEIVTIDAEDAAINALQTGLNSFVMTVGYETADATYIVESYVAQRDGTGPGPGPHGGGGSSGCNAGMMPMMLLGLAALPFAFRRK